MWMMVRSAAGRWSSMKKGKNIRSNCAPNILFLFQYSPSLVGYIGQTCENLMIWGKLIDTVIIMMDDLVCFDPVP